MEDLGVLFGLLKEGKIKPSLEKRMRLEYATQTHESIENVVVKGRIVLIVNK